MKETGFLKNRFPGLAKSPEVERTAKRTARKTGEDIPKENYEARIANYLDRFKEIIERTDPYTRERGIQALKKILTNHYVVHVEDVPESYWNAQMRVVRERGSSGDWQELSDDDQLALKQEHLAQTKEDQKGSLEEWIDYLSSERSSYLPDHLKYWAFQGMLKLERYEKGNKEKNMPGRFPERPTGKQRSVKMFPEVNERALRFIAESYAAHTGSQSIHFRYDIPEQARQQFLELLKKHDFRSLYGWAQEYLPPISEKELQTVEGQWVTYAQNSDPKLLAKSLQGKGSGWCIAGQQIAKQYLDEGPLSIYYTRDRDGNFTIPRVVIVQQGNRVTEVRGIEWEENVDQPLKATNIIIDKLRSLPGGDEFYETDHDTKELTAIGKRIEAGTELTREELLFLYEVEKQIKYFGEMKDPRIQELLSKRNPKEDAPRVLECAPNQVAWSQEEFLKNPNNFKVYVGPLFDGIFAEYPNLEYVYTAFPERKINKFEPISISEELLKKGAEFSRAIQEDDMKVLDDSMLTTDKTKDGRTFDNLIDERRKEVQDLLKKGIIETLHLVRLTVQDLFNDNSSHTTKQIWQKAKDLGLELCPVETGPLLRLAVGKSQPHEIYWRIAHEQICISGGKPHVFGLYSHHRGGAGLGRIGAKPDRGWDPDDLFVFRLRPSTKTKSDAGQTSSL